MLADVGHDVLPELGARSDGRSTAVELSRTCGAGVDRPAADSAVRRLPPADDVDPSYGPALHVGPLRSVVESFAPDRLGPVPAQVTGGDVRALRRALLR